MTTRVENAEPRAVTVPTRLFRHGSRGAITALWLALWIGIAVGCAAGDDAGSDSSGDGLGGGNAGGQSTGVDTAGGSANGGTTGVATSATSSGATIGGSSATTGSATTSNGNTGVTTGSSSASGGSSTTTGGASSSTTTGATSSGTTQGASSSSGATGANTGSTTRGASSTSGTASTTGANTGGTTRGVSSSSSTTGANTGGTTAGSSSSGTTSANTGGTTAGASSSSGTTGANTGGTTRGASSSSSTTGGTTGTTGTTGTSGTTGSTGSTTGSASSKFAGNITTNGAVRSDFVTYWNQITPENEGKWGSVEGTMDKMNWGPLDAVHDYAKQHGIVFKQHNFVWGQQQPSWLSGLSAANQKAQVEQWIQLFCQRYPDVALIDVVNEPTHNQPVYMNAIGGAGTSGFDWIVQALNWAHQYCPNAILLVNDYNTIEYQADNTNFINLINKIKAAGAPINAIGAQGHDAYKLSTSTVQGFLQKLEGTGLPVYITEYDINLADDNQQKTVMQSEFTMFWNDNKVKGITLWGYIEGATWETNTGLMTSGGQMRPAMTWLMGFLGR